MKSGSFWTPTACASSGRPRRAFRPSGTVQRSRLRDIAYRKMNGPDVLMFPIAQVIGPPEHVLSPLTIELKWKDIDFRADPFGGRSPAPR